MFVIYICNLNKKLVVSSGQSFAGSLSTLTAIQGVVVKLCDLHIKHAEEDTIGYSEYEIISGIDNLLATSIRAIHKAWRDSVKLSNKMLAAWY